MVVPYFVGIDPSYQEFQKELDALFLHHEALASAFGDTVKQMMLWSDLERLASPQLVESAFDGSYALYKLTYQSGALELYARLEGNVLAFITILKPKMVAKR